MPFLFLETVLLNLELNYFTQKGHWKIYNNVCSFHHKEELHISGRSQVFVPFFPFSYFFPSLSSLFSLFEILFDVAHVNGI